MLKRSSIGMPPRTSRNKPSQQWPKIKVSNLAGFFDLTQFLQKKTSTHHLTRFVQQFESGRGDYTHDRDAWLRDESVEVICERIAQRDREKTCPNSSRGS